MNSKHFFVPVLDVGELIPFGIKQQKNIQSDLAEQERARRELSRFAEILERNLKKKLTYVGMDVIGEKAYERFLIEGGGFLEAMVETPVALNAHFTNQNDAKKFLLGLKKSFLVILKKSPLSTMLVDSLAVQDQEDSSLTVSSWNKIKNVRGNG